MSFVQKLFAGLAACFCVNAAIAAAPLVDTLSVEYGTGPKVSFLRVGLQQPWDKAWFKSNGTDVTGYWDYSLTEWHATKYRNVPGQVENITTIGAVPVFRLENESHKGLYGEFGVGFFLFSRLFDNRTKRLSTAFEFGDQLGVGYVFDNQWEASLKIQHFSNGGIKHPNSGANFSVLKFSHPF